MTVEHRNSLLKSTTARPEYPGFGILGRYPIISLLVFAALGVGTGIGLMQWKPVTDDEVQAKATTIKWIGLMGDMFIRALKCVVLPLVFFSVVISIVDMMSLGRASSIAWRTIGYYLLTTIMASLIGVFSTLIWLPSFTTEDVPHKGPAMVSLGCNEAGSLLAELDDGTVVCTANFTDVEDTKFVITDITKSFTTNSNDPVTLGLSDTIYQGIFYKSVPDNIVGSFVEANFAAVIFFALAFGFALGKVMDNNRRKFGQSEKEDLLINVFQEINDVFVIFINWIIMCTPFAVWSLIASAMGKQNDAAQQFKNVGYLVAAIITGQITHAILLWFVIFYLITRWDPFVYMKQILPAQCMAFACSSSAATIPVTLQSVRNTGRVPEAILRFIIPLGATVNMDGTALGYPVTCIWLAALNGIQPTAASYILLIIISTVGSIGTAPIPSAGLVLVITAYNTVFNTTGVPDGFGYVVAIDWFVDRLETMMNVTGDTVVCAFVAKTADLDEINNALPPAELAALEKELEKAEGDYDTGSDEKGGTVEVGQEEAGGEPSVMASSLFATKDVERDPASTFSV